MSCSFPTEPLEYKDTVCADGWVPWNSWCYKLVKDKSLSFTEAQSHCANVEGGGEEGSLASFHSIDTKEMISTNFHAGASHIVVCVKYQQMIIVTLSKETWTLTSTVKVNVMMSSLCVCCATSDGQFLDVWIGLISTDTNLSVFKWMDQKPVTFTYWAPNQPVHSTEGSACVFYTGEVCVCGGGCLSNPLPVDPTLFLLEVWMLPRPGYSYYILIIFCQIYKFVSVHRIMVGRLVTAQRSYLLCVRRKEKSKNQQHSPDVTVRM